MNALDVDALKALLYGLPSPGGRYDLIKYVCEGLARARDGIGMEEALSNADSRSNLEAKINFG